ncbi:hypothetical protein IV102_25050 [bacterium]|nr:hypothetical protein [bacterium]
MFSFFRKAPAKVSSEAYAFRVKWNRHGGFSHPERSGLESLPSRPVNW